MRSRATDLPTPRSYPSKRATFSTFSVTRTLRICISKRTIPSRVHGDWFQSASSRNFQRVMQLSEYFSTTLLLPLLVRRTLSEHKHAVASSAIAASPSPVMVRPPPPLCLRNIQWPCVPFVPPVDACTIYKRSLQDDLAIPRHGRPLATLHVHFQHNALPRISWSSTPNENC